MRPCQLREAMGITRREQAYWLRRGVLTSSAMSHGGHRRYERGDCVRARVAVALRRSGCSLSQVARSLEALAPELDLLVEASEAREAREVQGYCATGNTGTS